MKTLTMRETREFCPIHPSGEMGTLYRWEVLVYDGSKYDHRAVPLSATQQFGLDMGFIEPPDDLQPYRNIAASQLAAAVGSLDHAAPYCGDITRQTVVTGHYE